MNDGDENSKNLYDENTDQDIYGLNEEFAGGIKSQGGPRKRQKNPFE